MFENNYFIFINCIFLSFEQKNLLGLGLELHKLIIILLIFFIINLDLFIMFQKIFILSIFSLLLTGLYLNQDNL